MDGYDGSNQKPYHKSLKISLHRLCTSCSPHKQHTPYLQTHDITWTNQSTPHNHLITTENQKFDLYGLPKLYKLKHYSVHSPNILVSTKDFDYWCMTTRGGSQGDNVVS